MISMAGPCYILGAISFHQTFTNMFYQMALIDKPTIKIGKANSFDQLLNMVTF
jgi:hypothetical protein